MAISLTAYGAIGVDGENFGDNYACVWGEGNLGTYATGGIAVAVADVNTALTTLIPKAATLSSLTQLMICTSDVNGYKYGWDRSAGKVKAFSAGSTESAESDISANLFQWVAFGPKA